MKKVLSFDIDQTLNVAKTPITDDIAELLVKCLDHFEICPISGQKFDQFLIQIVDRLPHPTPEQLSHLHLFVAQGTQYYRYDTEKNDWVQVYNYPLTEEQVQKISETIEKSARELGYWEVTAASQNAIQHRADVAVGKEKHVFSCPIHLEVLRVDLSSPMIREEAGA